jgi:hypothetical protein
VAGRQVRRRGPWRAGEELDAGRPDQRRDFLVFSMRALNSGDPFLIVGSGLGGSFEPEVEAGLPPQPAIDTRIAAVSETLTFG